MNKGVDSTDGNNQHYLYMPPGSGIPASHNYKYNACEPGDTNRDIGNPHCGSHLLFIQFVDACYKRYQKQGTNPEYDS